MRELSEELSGAWSGWSIQDGIRITESIELVIRGGLLSGVGHDKDGDFEIAGSYQVRSHRVTLTRRYVHTTEPSQEGVGIPYDYEGLWDGTLVAGLWHPRSHPSYGGPFEMWPLHDEDSFSLSVFEQLALAAGPSAKLDLRQ